MRVSTSPAYAVHARRAWMWPLALVSLTLAWDATGLDLVVMSWLGDSAGFAWRDAPLLKTVLHDGARQMAWGLLAGVMVSAALPWGPWRRLTGRQRVVAISGLFMSLLAINLFKFTSQTSCPWELQAFGGAAQYVSHWSWGVDDGGSGRCFPGGHASAAFAFWALVWPWLTSPRVDDQRLGQRLAVVIAVAGVVLGTAQTLRGAHYPSHTLWTAVICGAVSWGWHRAWAPGPRRVFV